MKQKLKKPIMMIMTAIMVAAIFATSICPAFAASGDKTITIKPNGQEGVGNADRFKAYQIFKGTVSTGTDGQNRQLSNVQWGDGIKQAEIMDALKNSQLEIEAGTTFGSKFTEAFTQYEASGKGKMSEAQFVADWLGAEAQKENPMYAKIFARIAAEKKDGEGTASEKDGSDWKIKNLEQGYYLVIDEYESEGGMEHSDGAVSSYILDVIYDRDIKLKATIPTVEKKVEDNKGAVKEIGETINFTLTGTLPTNYDEYGKFAYKFTDIASKGLTIEESSVKVYLGEKGSGQEFKKVADLDGDFTATVTKEQVEKDKLTVDFTDLKKSTLKDSITSGSKITVAYTAKLNKDADITATGNSNSVVLEYSNNPYNGAVTGQTAATVASEAKAYTFGIHVIKQDNKQTPLVGAGFKLYKEGGTNYATIQDGVITGWVEGEQSGTEVLTKAEGGTFDIKGLGTGVYYLKETTTPEGYETMKDVKIQISASTDGNSGAITATAPTAPTDRDDVKFDTTVTDANGLDITLTNHASPILPSTGGTGRTLILCISGAVVLFGGLILIIAVKKKKREEV